MSICGMADLDLLAKGMLCYLSLEHRVRIFGAIQYNHLSLHLMPCTMFNNSCLLPEWSVLPSKSSRNVCRHVIQLRAVSAQICTSLVIVDRYYMTALPFTFLCAMCRIIPASQHHF